MVTIDAIEGIVNGVIAYHYDVGDDVLYLRLQSHRDAKTLGEETEDGLILLRDERDDEPVGLTIVNWWKRFGENQLPDSIQAIQKRIEPLATKLNNLAA